MPEHSSGDKNVVVLKIEKVKSKGGSEERNVNYMFHSKNPSDPDDIIYKLNSRIVSVKVIGGIVPSQEL